MSLLRSCHGDPHIVFGKCLRIRGETAGNVRGGQMGFSSLRSLSGSDEELTRCEVAVRTFRAFDALDFRGITPEKV
jgi:hypothetical protein